MNRIREGFVLVRNPLGYNQISRISLSPKVIDCIVFWTKDARPLLKYIDEISENYMFYFQYTLNGYGKDVEPNLPIQKQKIETFRKLSEKFGSDRVIWRYDPVLLNEKYTVELHIELFKKIAEQLKGYTNTCVFSFADIAIYNKVQKNLNGLNARECTDSEMNVLAKAFADIAHENGMAIQTCAEKIDLEKYGIKKGACTDGDLIEKITGYKLKKKGKDSKMDKERRGECLCMESVDIGQYNTCRHGCKYCYANFNSGIIKASEKDHNPNSPFLIGGSKPNDKEPHEREMKSLLDKNQKVEIGVQSFFGPEEKVTLDVKSGRKKTRRKK